MSERKQRTPAEIIAETEAKLARLQGEAGEAGCHEQPCCRSSHGGA